MEASCELKYFKQFSCEFNYSFSSYSRLKWLIVVIVSQQTFAYGENSLVKFFCKKIYSDDTYTCDIIFANFSRDIDFKVEIEGVHQPNARVIEELSRTSGVKVGELSEGLLYKFPNLKSLNLENVELKRMSVDSFRSCNKMEKIQLGENSLTEIPDHSFRYCSQLKNLKLQNNRLTVLSDTAFTGLNNLNYLDLTSNNLTSIDKRTFKQMSNLMELKLSYNQIELIQFEAFNDLKNLRNLLFTNNKLTSSSIDAAVFEKLNMLTTLDLSVNEISDLTSSMFRGLSNLMTLKLSGNAIKAIAPNTFEYLGKLYTLELDRNQISTMTSKTFVGLRELKRLNLNHNEIFNLGAEVFEPIRQLSELKLESNRLANIDSRVFKVLPSLIRLELSSNDLDDFMKPETFENLANLTYLAIANIGIEEIPSGVFRPLSKLESIKLSGNKIPRINKNSFGMLHNLKSLDVTDCHVDEIERSLLENFPKLTMFYATKNICVNRNFSFFGNITMSEMYAQSLAECYTNWDTPRATRFEFPTVPTTSAAFRNFQVLGLLAALIPICHLFH